MYKSAFVVVGILILATGVWYFAKPHDQTDLTGFPKLTDAALKDRTIVDFGYNADGTVSYSYLAEPVPETIAVNEVPELRTENSFTKFEGVVEEGEDPTLKLTTVVFTQPVYAQDVDGSWRSLEYATTTEQAFKNRNMTLWASLREMLVHTAYADSVSPFAGSGDGYITDNESASEEGIGSCSYVWSNVAGNTTGDTAVTNSITLSSSAFYTSSFDGFFESCQATIYRVFLPFDTSAISSSATISAASLNIYISSKVNGSDDTFDFISVVRTSQATHTTLAVTDYDNWTGTEGIDAGEREDITSMATSAYLVFNLNSTGMGWIAKNGVASNCSATTGITCLGVLEGNDIFFNQPFGIDSNTANFAASEATGTATDPYLSVTYTVGGAAVVEAARGLKMTGTGSLKILQGGLKVL